MGKILENKRKKMESLFNAAFELFITKGFIKTTISDIVEKAEVAKGTFYLYFKDKYDIRNKLVAHKTNQLFLSAYNALQETEIKGFEARSIFMANFVLDELSSNKGLLAFIHKDLSWAIFKDALIMPVENNVEIVNFKNLYLDKIKEANINFKNPEVVLFLIIELVSSVGHSAIMYADPMPLDELKPYIAKTITAIIRDNMI